MCVPKHDPTSTCKSHYSVNGSRALHSISAPASIMDQFSHCMIQTLLHLFKKKKKTITIVKKLLVERDEDDYWSSMIPNIHEFIQRISTLRGGGG